MTRNNADITLAELRDRLYEAIVTLAALPDRERRFIYHKMAFWPDVIQERLDAMGRIFDRLADFGEINRRLKPGEQATDTVVDYGEISPNRERPSGAAIDRMDEALPWLTWLDKTEFNIVVMRAKEMSWRRIAHRYGKTDTTVKRWHDDGIRGVHARMSESPGLGPRLNRLGRQVLTATPPKAA